MSLSLRHWLRSQKKPTYCKRLAALIEESGADLGIAVQGKEAGVKIFIGLGEGKSDLPMENRY